MKFLFFILFLFNYIYAIEIKIQDQFITDLYPKCNNKKVEKRVIQDLYFYKDNIIVSQTYKDKLLCINILDTQGKSLKSKLFKLTSHPQGLSMCDDKIYLRGKKKNLLVFDITSQYNINFVENLKLDKWKNTSTITKDCNYIVTISKNRIYIIDKNTMSEVQNFKVKEIKKKFWIQGIETYNNYIFILAGRNKIIDKKYIFIYDFDGNLEKKIRITTGLGKAIKKGQKWELEGLAFKDNSLYTVVIMQNNLKKLYKILEIINKEKY